MDARLTIWLFTLAYAVLAGWLDWRTRRIPNWLTVSGIFFGVSLRTIIAGWPGAKASLEGAGLALLLLLPFVLLRALGAGDWKLMAAVGAFLGPVLFLFVLVGSMFAAGLMAFVEAVKAKQLKTTLHNMLILVRGFVVFGFRANQEITLDNPKLLKVPFGVAVAASTMACFAVARWGL